MTSVAQAPPSVPSTTTARTDFASLRSKRRMSARKPAICAKARGWNVYSRAVPTTARRAGRREARMELRSRFHPEDRFGGFTELDGAIRFYARVRELLPPDGVALDVGCGRGTQGDDPVRVRRDLRILRGRCRKVIGIDVDPLGAENAFIDEFRLITIDRDWPVEEASVDLALADFVVEHVDDTDAFFTQVARALRPGGYLCIRTINVNSYLGVASRLVLSDRHYKVLRRTHVSRQAEDVFPTLYHCNTRRRLRGALERH